MTGCGLLVLLGGVLNDVPPNHDEDEDEEEDDGDGGEGRSLGFSSVASLSLFLRLA